MRDNDRRDDKSSMITTTQYNLNIIAFFLARPLTIIIILILLILIATHTPRISTTSSSMIFRVSIVIIRLSLIVRFARRQDDGGPTLLELGDHCLWMRKRVVL